MFQSLGAASNRNGAWTPASVNLNAFAGQTVRIRFEAADASTASLVEAGVDDVSGDAAVRRTQARRRRAAGPVTSVPFGRHILIAESC